MTAEFDNDSPDQKYRCPHVHIPVHETVTCSLYSHKPASFTHEIDFIDYSYMVVYTF
jgi:hypothetical protein